MEAWKLFYKDLNILSELNLREIQVVMMENCLDDNTMKIYKCMQLLISEFACTVQEILYTLDEYAHSITNKTCKCLMSQHRKKDE